MVVLNAGPPLVVDSPSSPATHYPDRPRPFPTLSPRAKGPALAPRTSGVYIVDHPLFRSPEVLTLSVCSRGAGSPSCPYSPSYCLGKLSNK
jgi:hypothetical protein